MTASQSRKMLLEGNERFIAGKQTADLSISRRDELTTSGQHPFAVIICCSDSRVPPELIFDQGLGDLFIIRTAGNVVDDVALGSIEYGAEHLGVPLIVVLGHENCGAVKATVDGGEVHGCIHSIVDKISPSLDKVRGAADLYGACEDENIRSVCDEIISNKIISALINEGKTEVVGAKLWDFKRQGHFFILNAFAKYLKRDNTSRLEVSWYYLAFKTSAISYDDAFSVFAGITRFAFRRDRKSINVAAVTDSTIGNRIRCPDTVKTPETRQYEQQRNDKNHLTKQRNDHRRPRLSDRQ